MLSTLLSGRFDLQSFIISLLLSLPTVMLALSVHETAHGFVAYKLGDPTARSLGRLTLNPAKHIDPLGFIFMLLFGYGWAKPVPINTRYFKKPKRDMVLTGAAGPISNFLLALIFALLWRVEVEIVNVVQLTSFTVQVAFWLETFLYIAVRLNISLAVFNLIPIPPFDGSRIFLSLLPSNLYFKIMRYERYLYILLMIALLMGVLDAPLGFISDWFLNLLLNIAF